jgi:hypothetical protein
MHRLNVGANSARTHLLGIAGWLCGCSHRRKTFPFPPRPTQRMDAGRRQKLTWCDWTADENSLTTR